MKKIIGVIGCKNREVTSQILKEVLKCAGKKVKIIKSRDDTGVYLNIKTKTDLEKETEIIILEINSSNIRQVYNRKLDLDIIIDTDISRYIDNKHIEDYISNKLLLINNLNKNSLLIINSDDKDSIKLSSKNKNVIVMTYGLNSKSSVTTSSINFDDNIKFNLCLQRKLNTLHNNYIEEFEHPILTNLISVESLYSTLAAISALLYLDIDIYLIAESISKLGKVRYIS